jgi:hypothetical protein
MFRSVRRSLAVALAALTALLLGPVLSVAASTSRPAAAHTFPRLASQYVRMPDGVRLATARPTWSSP